MASTTIIHIPESALNKCCFLACFKIYPPKPGTTLRLIGEMLTSLYPDAYAPMNHRPGYYNINNGIFVAKFDNSDEDRVFNAAPYIYRGDLIAVKKYVEDNSSNSDHYDFHISPFWIRIYDLPLDCLTAQAAIKIASDLGTNARGISDEEIRTGSKKFARVRVDIDVSYPLKESLPVDVHLGNNTEKITVRIMYEELPNYCDYCGRVGHLHNMCKVPDEDRVRIYLRSSLTVAPPSLQRMTPVRRMNDGCPLPRPRTAFQSVSQHFIRFSGHS